MGQRDATIILVAYRHGLRAAELVDFRWIGLSSQQAPAHPQGQTGHAEYHAVRYSELSQMQFKDFWRDDP